MDATPDADGTGAGPQPIPDGALEAATGGTSALSGPPPPNTTFQVNQTISVNVTITDPLV